MQFTVIKYPIEDLIDIIQPIPSKQSIRKIYSAAQGIGTNSLFGLVHALKYQINGQNSSRYVLFVKFIKLINIAPRRWR